MAEKKIIIDAIKSLDFKALHKILDDNRSYMEVSKDLFLSTLKQHLDKYVDLKFYENVVEGTCNYCNKGCKAYKFKTENFPSLPLYFEEKDGEVTDIYLCHSIHEETVDEDGDWNIDFSFFEEDKINFTPTVDYIRILPKIEEAVEKFNHLASMGVVPIETLVNWYDVNYNLVDELGTNDPFASKKYKAYTLMATLYTNVDVLVYNYKNVEIAKQALETCQCIDKEDEESIVQWLLDHENFNFFSLKEADEWEKTGVIVLQTNPKMIVDCNLCFYGFLLSKTYSRLHHEIMEKYKPTEEHYKNNGGGIEYSLESYLTLHDKYSDLIAKNRISKVMSFDPGKIKMRFPDDIPF